MSETTIDTQRLAAIMRLPDTETLRYIIAIEREDGHAFGVIAEACRVELAKRGEQA